LKSIAGQTYPNKEIIVVDGGSRDKTLIIASKYATKIVSDKGSLGQARQRGVEESTGEILGLFDSDIVLPTRNWTDKAVQKFQKTRNIGVVWPINKPPENSSIVARCYFLLWEMRRSEFVMQTGEKSLVPGGNSLVLRKALDAAGGFNKKLKFGEDLELGRRITKLGFEVAIFEEPIIHDTMWSLKEYTKKQFWGASSLAAADTSTINLAINWNGNKSGGKRGSLALNVLGFISASIRGMITGLARDRDKAWLLIPLLLAIRSLIYSRFLLYRALSE
jgi:glycosyltransferase involved in cell wall biosynthesis